MHAPFGRAVLGALTVGLWLCACEPGTPQRKTEVITIDQLAFGKAPDDLRVGDTLEWVNSDQFEHSATAKDGQFDVDLPPGKRAGVVLSKAGTVAYYCRYHPNMTGQFTVQP